MGKKAKILALILAMMVTFSAGVSAREEEKGRVVVEKINVHGLCGKGWVLRKYHKEEKVCAVLNRLRAFRREGAAKEDPETLGGSDYRIRIYYSDGSTRQYRLKAGQYLRRGGEIWYRVDKDRAEKMQALVWELETDPGVDLPASS